MKTLIRLMLLSLLISTCLGVAFAGNPARHPRYLHALSDLRLARAYLEHRTDNDRRADEQDHAIRKINDAINEIKRASIDDGKSLDDHAPIDTNLRGGRYHKVLELLDSAHRDVTMEEEDPQAQGLQGRVIKHIDEAHRIVEHIASEY